MKTFKPGCLLLLGIVVVLVVLDDICPLPSGCLTEWQRGFFDPHPEQTLSGVWYVYRCQYNPIRTYVKIEDASLLLGTNGIAKLSGLDKTGCRDFNDNPMFTSNLVETTWWVCIDTNNRFRSIYFDLGGKHIDFYYGMDYYRDWFIILGDGTHDDRIVMFKDSTKVPVSQKKYFASW